MFNKQFLKRIRIFALCLCCTVFAVFGIAACGGGEEPATPVLYSLTFVGGEGATGEAPTLEKVAEGTEITLPANTFEKAGYAFEGWNDGEADYAAGASYVIGTADVTFTATWKEVFTVTFSLGDHAAVDAMAPAAFENKESGEKITLPAAPAAEAHYTFSAWTDGTNTYAAEAEYTVVNSATISAVWTVNQYAVRYDGNGATGTVPTETEYAYNTKIDLPAQGDLEKEGHTFKGWATAQNAASAIEGQFTVVESVVLYAVWVVNEYAVSYDANGATGAAPVAAEYAYGTKIDLPTQGEMVKAGYVFKGWATAQNAENAIEGQFTVVESVVLYAVWKQLVSVSYDLGVNAAEGEITPATQTVEAGAVITLPDAPNAAIGWKFYRWRDGNTYYDAGEEYTVTQTVVIEAYWDFSFSVTFDLGAHAAADAVAPAPMFDLAMDTKITLPDAPAAAEGYRFAGWREDNFNYQPGASYWVDSVVTFTAVWEEKLMGTFAFIGSNIHLQQNLGLITVNVRNVTRIEICLDTMTVKYTLGTNEYEAENVAIHTVHTVQKADVLLQMQFRSETDNRALNVWVALWRDRTRLDVYQTDRNFTNSTLKASMEPEYPVYNITFTSGETTVLVSPTNREGIVASIHRPIAPQKTGYTFQHWSLEENGVAVDLDTQVFTADDILYAVYKANE